MADTEHAEHHGPGLKEYMIIFGVLSVCTSLSFMFNWIFGIGSMTGLLLIMIVSIVKATLVALVFMHLKWDWGKVFFILIPVMILTVMMVIVLLPDAVLSPLSQSEPPSSGLQGAVESEK